MKKLLNLLVVMISILTILSGGLQLFAPRKVLSWIDGAISPTSAHFFGIIGMFMIFFGGLMLHAVYSARPQCPAVFWCALQKLGAFVAVGLGILHHLFSMMALSVAIFDLFSGVLFLYYLRQISR